MTNEQKAEQPVPADEPTCLGAGDLVRIRDTARAVFHGRDQVAFDVIEWYHASLLGEVAALAASPQAAPVAEETVYETIIHWDEGGGKRSRRELARRIVALYLAPQAAQAKAEPLTDEQIASVWRAECSVDGRTTTADLVRAFARAIERAHGIAITKEAT